MRPVSTASQGTGPNSAADYRNGMDIESDNASAANSNGSLTSRFSAASRSYGVADAVLASDGGGDGGDDMYGGGSGNPMYGFGSGSGLGLRPGSGMGLSYGGVRAPEVSSTAPITEEDGVGGLNDVNGMDLQSDLYAGGRSTVTIGSGRAGSLLGAMGSMSEADRRAAYGQLIRTGQLGAQDFDAKGMPVVREGREFYLDANDFTDADRRLGGRLIANESGNRAALAAVKAAEQDRANQESWAAMQVGGWSGRTNQVTAGAGSSAALGGLGEQSWGQRANSLISNWGKGVIDNLDQAAVADGGGLITAMAAAARTPAQSFIGVVQGAVGATTLLDGAVRSDLSAGLTNVMENPSLIKQGAIKYYDNHSWNEMLSDGYVLGSGVVMCGGVGKTTTAYLNKVPVLGADVGAASAAAIDAFAASRTGQQVGAALENFMYRTGGLNYVVAPTERVISWSNDIPEISPFVTRYDPAFPGRPDPKFTVDTSQFTSGTPTSGSGGVRNSSAFWKEWATSNPDSLSPSNLRLAERGSAPRIDQTWVSVFPEHQNYVGVKLFHHHVDFGRYAMPVPASTHSSSSGIWHLERLK